METAMSTPREKFEEAARFLPQADIERVVLGGSCPTMAMQVARMCFHELTPAEQSVVSNQAKKKTCAKSV